METGAPASEEQLGGGHALECFGGRVAVGVDGLHVVLLLERVEQPHQRAGPLLVATVIARASFVNSSPRLASSFFFLCLIPAHFE